MMKSILKRTASVMLALLLAATAFFFTPLDLFTTAQAAVTATNTTSYGNVYFVVPEAIYLAPVYNAYTASTTSTFQWYVNNTLSSSGTVTTDTGESATGKIYFNYANTSSVRISFHWQTTLGTNYSSTSTIAFGNTAAKAPGTTFTAVPSFTSDIPITSGSCPALGATARGIYIQWEAVYTDNADGLTKTAYAYTYVYKPYVYPIATAQRSENTRGSNYYGQNLSWISGVHGTSVARTYYPKTDTSNGFLPFSSSAGASGSNVTPQMTAYFRTNADNWGAVNWLSESATDAPDRSCAYYVSTDNAHTSGDDCIINFTYSATGLLTVDTSRYTNLNQIPNLTVGLMVTDDENSSSGAAYFISNRSTNSPAYSSDFTDYQHAENSASCYTYWNTYYNDDQIAATGNYTNMCGSESEGVKINTRWRKSISSSSPSATYYLGAGFANHRSGNQILNVAELRCQVNMYNKSALRTAYFAAMRTFAANNETLLKSTYWSQFISLYRAVARELCKVDGVFGTVTVNGTTYTSADALANALMTITNQVSTFSSTYRETYTATQRNVKVYAENGTWKLVSNSDIKTSLAFYRGAQLTFTSESYAGYTYAGFRTMAETQTTAGSATSGTSSNVTSGNYTVTHANSVVTCSFYYLRNEYTITYDLQNGVVAGSNPTSYNVETQTFTLQNPTRTGYVFLGWTGSNGTTPQTTVTISKGSYGNKSYTANWSGTTYSISYDLTGGTGATANPTNYTVETPTFTLQNPTKTGYTFRGWTGSNGEAPQTTVTIPQGSVGNRSYTANWTTTAYTITYILGGGSFAGGAVAPTVYTIESPAITLQNPTRSGYTFAGWTGTGLTGATMQVTIPAGSTGDRSYTATWTAVSYTISYNLNGGSVATANPTSYNVNTTTFTLNNPTKTGYTFAGWTGTGISGSSTSVTVAKGSTGNRSYTANWTANGYTVTLDPKYYANSSATGAAVTSNGSTSASPTYGSAMPSITVPTYTGYTFGGYFTSKTGTGTQYYKADGTSNRAWDIANNTTTLYAKWTIVTYTITYDLAGGSVATANPTSYNVTTATFTLNNPTKTGYTFGGWTGTGISGTSTSVTVAKGSIGNRAYTATWTAVTYAISYNLNGGSVAAPNKTTYTIETPTFMLNNPSKNGYTFAGWTGTGLSAATTTVKVTQGSTGNRMYTANWMANPYTIRFDVDGGVALPDKNYTIESTDTLPEAERSGFMFLGWVPASSVGTWNATSTYAAGSSLIGKYGSVTLTALWESTEHEHEYSAVVIPPTCNEYGYTAYTCVICGESYVGDIVHAYGHAWDDGTVTTPATCETTGEITYTCRRCLVTRTYGISRLGHDWDEGTVVTPATCETEGETVYTCQRCGKTQTNAVAPLGHDYDGTVTPPTCTQQGYTTFVCRNDPSHTYIGEYVDALEHDFGDWEVTTPPTTEQAGEETRTCTRCGETETRPVPPLSLNSLLTVSDATGHPGKTFDVTVSVSDNPGFISLMLQIGYDSQILTLVSVQNSGMLRGDLFHPGNDYSANPFRMYWVDALSGENHTDNGVLVTLTFAVAADAADGTTPITITYVADSTLNVDLQEIPFDTQGGTVTITRRTPGDVNGDGAVNLLDVILISRFLAGGWNVEIDESNADVDASANVTLADVVLLERYLAGGWGVVLQ